MIRIKFTQFITLAIFIVLLLSFGVAQLTSGNIAMSMYALLILVFVVLIYFNGTPMSLTVSAEKVQERFITGKVKAINLDAIASINFKVVRGIHGGKFYEVHMYGASRLANDSISIKSSTFRKADITKVLTLVLERAPAATVDDSIRLIAAGNWSGAIASA